MTPQLTPELTKQFYIEACQKFGATIVQKDDSEFMAAIATVLNQLNITDRDDFMKRFTTTIGTKIYVPFDVGIAGDYTLEDQVDVLVHELVHVQQYDANEPKFVLCYLLNEAARAEYEAQAYSADMEMHYWRTGRIYDIRGRAQLLDNYALEQDEINFAAEYMESIATTIQEGAAVNNVAAWAMDWMEQHGVQGAA